MGTVSIFRSPDFNSWATYDVTFVPDTSDAQKEQEKLSMVELISTQVPTDPERSSLEGVLTNVDNEHSRLDVDFVSPEGQKVTRGAVRPPAVAKPPASRVVVSADLVAK